MKLRTTGKKCDRNGFLFYLALQTKKVRTLRKKNLELYLLGDKRASCTSKTVMKHVGPPSQEIHPRHRPIAVNLTAK